MAFIIRPYHPSDLPTLYRICLLTGHNGADASALYHDPELLGHFYAGPYAVLEPELCFVLTQDGAPCGYVLGTHDGAAFSAACERDWFPPLRMRYSLPSSNNDAPDEQIIRLIHQGHRVNDAIVGYPAELHIDLLPSAQGQGWGRELMQTFLAQLRSLQVGGVRLGVGRANSGAIAFYQRIGFQPLQEHPTWVAMGMLLT